MKPTVVVGIGELGAVFARGLLRAGHPVFPVTREQPASRVASNVDDPELVLLGVGEQDFGPVVQSLPEGWRDRLALVQNELLPRDWERHGIAQPTVAVVWLEKKKGTPVHVVQPTVFAGPHAELLRDALERIDVAARTVEPGPPLVFELVTKNLYILTTNLAGLEVGGTVRELWGEHRELAERVASDILTVQEGLVGRPLPREELMQAMLQAFDADPDHRCTGRSAPARLERTLAHADALSLEVPELRALQSRVRT